MTPKVASIACALLTAAAAAAQAPPEPLQPVNRIVELLEGGHPVFGLFSGPKTPESAMALSRTEADFVFYSMESGPFDVPGMQVYMQFLLDRARVAEDASSVHPVVTRIPPIRDGRVEAQDRTKRVLDAGAYGVVFPHVMSADEAAHAAASMRFRPEGNRPRDAGVAARYWGVEETSYVARAGVWPLDPGGQLVNVVLIEDKEGIENADAIVSTPGVSVAIPGPGDLRRAYEGDMQAVEAAIQKVLASCKAHDVVCGITAGPDDIERRLREGFRFFIVNGPEAIAAGRRASGR